MKIKGLTKTAKMVFIALQTAFVAMLLYLLATGIIVAGEELLVPIIIGLSVAWAIWLLFVDWLLSKLLGVSRIFKL